jgi:hypothetical protein
LPSAFSRFGRPGCGLFADDGLAVHVGDEGVGDADGAVGLLVVFEDREVGAADGEAAAVEGVDELGLFGAGGRKRMLARRAWKASKLEQEEISR